MHRSVVLLFCLLLSLPVSGQHSEVFAPGVVTIDGLSMYRGAFSPSGDMFYFFRKNGDTGEHYSIYRTLKQDFGWSDPIKLDLAGTGESELYPAVSPDGSTLVFTSYRRLDSESDEAPNANLWKVSILEEGFGEPVYLSGLSTPSNYDAGPRFDDSGRLHFKTTLPDWRTSHAKVSDSTLEHVEMDHLLLPWEDWKMNEYHVWTAVPHPDGEYVLLDVSPKDEEGRRGPTDQWVSFRSGDEWTDPIKLPDSVNAPDTYENFVVFTPDGKRMLFVRGFEQYRSISTDVIRALKPR